MKTFFFTFGHGKAFKDKFVGVIAQDEEQARQAMFDHFGDKWAFNYPAPLNLRRQTRDFNLKPLIFLKAHAAGYTSIDENGNEFFERLAVEEGNRGADNKVIHIR